MYNESNNQMYNANTQMGYYYQYGYDISMYNLLKYLYRIAQDERKKYNYPVNPLGFKNSINTCLQLANYLDSSTDTLNKLELHVTTRKINSIYTSTSLTVVNKIILTNAITGKMEVSVTKEPISLQLFLYAILSRYKDIIQNDKNLFDYTMELMRNAKLDNNTSNVYKSYFDYISTIIENSVTPENIDPIINALNNLCMDNNYRKVDFLYGNSISDSIRMNNDNFDTNIENMLTYLIQSVGYKNIF